MYMKSAYLLSIFVLALVAIPVSPLSAAKDIGNLIYNSSFEEIGPNGDPVGWLRGGYGNNTSSHEVIPCPIYTGFRPTCPEGISYALRTSIGNYVDGDTKWYFADVPIKGNKSYTLSYQYQARVFWASSQTIARYKFKDGSYQYELIDSPLPAEPGGNGYLPWIKATNKINPPKNAVSFTIFFALNKYGVCYISCTEPREGGSLMISDVDLRVNR